MNLDSGLITFQLKYPHIFQLKYPHNIFDIKFWLDLDYSLHFEHRTCSKHILNKCNESFSYILFVWVSANLLSNIWSLHDFKWYSRPNLMCSAAWCLMRVVSRVLWRLWNAGLVWETQSIAVMEKKDHDKATAATQAMNMTERKKKTYLGWQIIATGSAASLRTKVQSLQPNIFNEFTRGKE